MFYLILLAISIVVKKQVTYFKNKNIVKYFIKNM